MPNPHPRTRRSCIMRRSRDQGRTAGQRVGGGTHVHRRRERTTSGPRLAGPRGLKGSAREGRRGRRPVQVSEKMRGEGEGRWVRNGSSKQRARPADEYGAVG
uniref:Uncharacterized protein n=1 Tax=Plectus sambesii TaxID=2011161 RepID=A0A914X8B5_9BILA